MVPDLERHYPDLDMGRADSIVLMVLTVQIAARVPHLARGDIIGEHRAAATVMLAATSRDRPRASWA